MLLHKLEASILPHVVILTSTFTSLPSLLLISLFFSLSLLLLFLPLPLSFLLFLFFLFGLFSLILFQLANNLRAQTVDSRFILFQNDNYLFSHLIKSLDKFVISCSQLIPSFLVINIIEHFINNKYFMRNRLESLDKYLEFLVYLHKAMLPYQGCGYYCFIFNLGDLVI